MTYMGDVLWGEGLKLSNERVKAIVEAFVPHPKSQRTPRVSTELEMVVKLSCFFISLPKSITERYRSPRWKPAEARWKYQNGAKHTEQNKFLLAHAQKNVLLSCCPCCPCCLSAVITLHTCHTLFSDCTADNGPKMTQHNLRRRLRGLRLFRFRR